MSCQRHKDTKLRFADGIEEIRSYRLDAVNQSEEHINPEIPLGELIVKLASFSEDTDDLSWEKLEACKRNQRQEGSGSKCQKICFLHAAVFLCAVIKSDDRLDAL